MIAISEDLTRGAWDELSFHFAPQIVLSTALKLGIFPAIAEGAEDIDSIASATECSTRGVRMLLNCMVSLGLLEKDRERYGLNNFSRRYFLSSSGDYIGGLLTRGDQLMELWLTLPEAVRTGKPSLSFWTDGESSSFNVDIVDGLFQVHKGCAWRLVEVLQDDPHFLTKRDASIKVLDAAAGSAVWSIPFALTFERAKVTAVDFFPLLAVAKRYTRRFGVEDRYRFLGGNIREIDLGKGEYDLVLLGHICHSEGDLWSQKLIAKCFRALRDSGRLFIMDYVPDEERKSPTLPLLLALNALLGTREGDTFTFSEYRQWLMSAGFNAVKTIEISGHSPVMVGLKS